MNSYPPELIVQLAPLMFVAGLDNTQDGFVVRLRNVLLSQRKQAIYQPSPQPTTTFHVQLVDKNVMFPPRKLPGELGHSPLSPLSPSSPLHPDGIIAPIWVRKHTTLLPCVFVLFLSLSEDETDKEKEREQDTALSTFIASRKRLTSERSIKLTVVLLASRRLLDDPALEPRLTFIRRQSGLDARASLFVLSPVGNRELAEFVKSLQNALTDIAAEYYAAHGRRVRRKRNKHSQPSAPPPGLPPIAQTVPIPRPLRPEGWSVRYSYKLAAFAEFRGELEVALKHYQEAYSSLCHLFSSPGPMPVSSAAPTLSTVSSLPSPPSLASLAPLPARTKRWAEAKVLCDCINIKIVKLFLYNNEHSLACAQHHSHVALFSEMSERRWGIGEGTFEFWSWVGRQYRVLAELIDQGLRSTLILPSHACKPSNTLVPNIDFDPVAQKSQILSNSNSGLNATHALLHSGYYYYAAARCAEMRRKRFLIALQAEAENKPVVHLSPGFTNEKKVDHLGLVVELYTKAYDVFKSASVSTTTAVPTGEIAPATGAQGEAAVASDGTGEMQAGTGGLGGRQLLWIAYRIAETYREGGKYGLAVRFFDRIAKTYRKEGWIDLLKGVLEAWFECAMGLGGQVEDGVKVLLELISLGGSQRGEDDLMGLLKTTKPSVIDKPLVVELYDTMPLFETEAVFHTPSIKFSESSALQIRMTSNCAWRWEMGGIGHIEVWFTFGEREGCVVLNHKREQAQVEETESDEGNSENAGLQEKPKRRIRIIELGEVVLGLKEEREDTNEKKVIKEVEANLQWENSETLVFCGLVGCWCVGVVEVTKIVVVIEEPQNGWVIEVPIVPGSWTARMRGVAAPQVDWWLSSVDPPRFVPLRREAENNRGLFVKYRDHLIHVSFSHHAPAYVDEEYLVDVEVRNLDDRPLEVALGFLVRPGEDELVVNWIMVDGQRSASLIKDVELGVVEPGGFVAKKVILVCTGVRGERVVDVQVLTRVVMDESNVGKTGEEDMAEEETMEHLELLVVNAVEPFRVEYDVMYAHSSLPAPSFAPSGKRTTEGWVGLADLTTFDASWRDERGEGAVEALVCGTVFIGNREEQRGEERMIVVEKIELERTDGRRARILDSDVESNTEGLYPAEYIEGDEFCMNCRVSLCVDDDDSVGGNMPSNLSQDMIEEPGRYCLIWHRILPGGAPGPSVKTRLELPTLHPQDKTRRKDETDNHLDTGLVALLRVPAVGRLHQPLIIDLILRNESQVRTADVSVSIAVGAGPGIGEAENEAGGGQRIQQQQPQFVLAGIKNARVGVVLPGEEMKLVWVVVPLECGYLDVPRVRVLDRRGGEGSGEEVEVVDAERFWGDEEKVATANEKVGSVLVLP